MSGLDDLVSIIPIDQIAARLGVDRDTARSAVDAALPALVGGLQANAEDPAGAASLSKALATKDPSLIAGGVSLDDVDDADGAKIVSNVFGPNQDQVIAALGSTGKADGGLLSKLLPILAPIVMAFLAKKVFGGSKAEPAATPTSSLPGADRAEPSGGGLGDILGSVLGGGSSSGGSGGGLGDILGSVLGGGSGSGGGLGGLGDVLGGLLGAGKR